MILPSRPTAAGQARQYVADALDDVEPAMLATAVLLASELVADAVVHGSPPVTLRILRSAEVLRIEVADGGVALARAQDVAVRSSSSETGRGLLLVEALAAHWGCDVRPRAVRGQTSWFDLELEVASSRRAGGASS